MIALACYKDLITSVVDHSTIFLPSYLISEQELISVFVQTDRHTDKTRPASHGIADVQVITGNKTRSLTHQIDDDGISEEQREAEQHPRQIRSLEGEEAEEIHANVRIASAPDVHKHDGERLAKEHQANKHCNELLSPVNENSKQ